MKKRPPRTNKKKKDNGVRKNGSGNLALGVLEQRGAPLPLHLGPRRLIEKKR